MLHHMGQAMYDIFLVSDDCLQEGLESVVFIFMTVGERSVKFELAFEAVLAVFSTLG